MANYGSLLRQLRNYWTMDNGSYPYRQFDKTRSCFLYVSPLVPGSIPTTGLTAVGKLGNALDLSSNAFGAYRQNYSSLVFTTDPTAVTISVWFRLDDSSVDSEVFSCSFASPPTGGYALEYLTASSTFRFRVVPVAPMPLPGTPVDASVSATVVDESWFHALAFIDITNQRIGLRINNGTTVWTSDPDIDEWPTGSTLAFGKSFPGLIDDSAVWSRILSDSEQNWLWNSGDGLGYSDFGVQAADTTCAEIPCCDEDLYTYEATAATASGAETGSDCLEVPVVTIEPPSGSFVTFPTYIFLSASMSGSVIRYTTDGTDPTEDSTVYSIPFEILGESTTVKAKAWYGDCDGPIAVAQYRRPDWDFSFYNVCPVVALRAGIWGVFTPPASGTNYGWILEFTPSAPVHFTRLEIYETNSAGVWNTGQAWSTAEYIDPPNGTTDFHVYPLVLDEGGQINAAYSDDFGTDFGDFAAAAHTVEMFGYVQVDIPGVTYFRLRMFLEDGSVLERIIASNVCTPPPCEQYPPPPTLTIACGQITVSWTDTAASLYQLWRYSGDTGTVVQVASGTNSGGLDTYVDTAVVPGVLYCYHLRTKYASCPVYMAGHTGCGTGLAFASLTATPDTTLLECPSTAVTVTIHSQNLLAGGACADAAVHYDYTDGSGHHTDVIDGVPVSGNTEQVLIMTLVRPAVAPYEVVITFTACSPCNTETVSITVEFEPPACCTVLPGTIAVDTSALLPAVQAITGACATQLCTLGIIVTGFPTPWNGSIPYSSACRYIEQGTLALCNFVCDGGTITLGYVYATVEFYGTCGDVAAYWTLGISLVQGDNQVEVWTGTKYCGDNPTGLYTRVSGCCTLATLRVS